MGQGSPREIGEQRGANERKHGLMQQAAGLTHSDHSLDEQADMVGLCSMRHATPDHRMAQDTFCGMIGGIDARQRDRFTESGIQGPQVTTGFRRAGTIT